MGRLPIMRPESALHRAKRRIILRVGETDLLDALAYDQETGVDSYPHKKAPAENEGQM